MAAFTGPSISEIPGWRIGLIFLLFCVIALLYDHGAAALDRYLKRNRKRALRHVIRRLQGELLVLGLLSLLLVAFESYLLKICIGCSPGTCAWDCPAREPEAPLPAAEAAGGGGRRLQQLGREGLPSAAGLLLEGAVHEAAVWRAVAIRRAHGGRGLLASSKTGELSCMQAAETCPPGSEPFWSQLALVQAHLFLFVIACVHIIYACISLLICQWKLRRWRRYEQEAGQSELRPLHSRFLPRQGDNPISHFCRCTLLMVTDSVNSGLYCGMRRLFIERLDVEPTFDFHSFLVESMEEEFAGIVGVNSVLWCIVLLWIMLPPESYQLIWLSALAVGAAFVVAVKLQSIIISLAEAAIELYGCRPEKDDQGGVLQSVKATLQRLSRLSAGRPPSPTIPVAANASARVSVAREGQAFGVEDSSDSSSDSGRRQQGAGQQSGQEASRFTPVHLGRGGSLLRDDSAAGGSGGEPGSASIPAAEQHSTTVFAAASPGHVAGSREGDMADALEEAAEEAAEEAEEGEESSLSGDDEPAEVELAAELADQGAPPEQAAAFSAAAGELAQQEAECQAAGIVGSRGRCSGQAPGAGEGPQHAEQAQHVQQQQQHAEAQLGSELPFDLEAQDQPAQAARAAASAGSAPHPDSSVFRRCCPWLLPRLPWHRRQQQRRVGQAIERSQSFAETYGGPDAASLFWFGRPRVMLRIVQAVWFENSLSVAAALFSVWQGVDFDTERYGGWKAVVPMICVELALLVFMSLMVLPAYALTTAAGSHSAASVIKHALRNKSKPEMARTLVRISMRSGQHAIPSSNAQPAGPSSQQLPSVERLYHSTTTDG